MADPKDKWTRPLAPPAPMFFGKKERDLVKQINDELSERVIGQPIAYYPISTEESNFNQTYGEAIEKVSLPPVRVYAYVDVTNIQSNEKFGYDYQTKLKVYFSERRIVEDQNLYVRVGDFIQYGEFFYEIVKIFEDTRYYFGQVEHKFQIATECVRARKGTFRVMPAVDRPTTLVEQAGEQDNPAPRAAPYPPLAASYVTVNPDSKLPNERVLTAGTGITITDGGPNNTITIAAAGANAQGIAGAVQLQHGGGNFAGNSNLVFLTGSGRLGINTSTPNVSFEVSASSTDDSPAARLTGLRPRVQFYETDQTTQYQIQTSNGMLKWQVQNNDFDDASVKWAMNSDGQMAFRDGAAGKPIPARVYISGSGNSNLLQVSSSTAANILVVTGSGKVGIGTAAPSHELTVLGSVSASTDVLVGGDLTVKGILVGGSPVKISGGLSIVNHLGAQVGEFAPSHTGELTISGSCVQTGDISASLFVSSSYFYGDGRYLTNITASATTVADGPVGSLQFRVNTPETGEISGSSQVLYDISNNRLSFGGGLTFNRTAVSTRHTASVSNYILGVTAVPTEILFDATLFSNGQGLVIKDESGAANATNAITLVPSASQTIDGLSSAIIESPYGSVFLYSDGTNWFIY